MTHHQRLLTGGSPITAGIQRAGIVNVAMDYSIVVTRFLFFWPKGLFPDQDLTTNPYAYGLSPLQSVIGIFFNLLYSLCCY